MGLCLFILPQVFASESKIEQALRLLSDDAKDFESARALLEEIPTSDPHFKIAVEELMKIYYRDQNWPKFFSYAQYYRIRWKAYERSEVQLLEVLALLRHCQNENLERLLSEFRNQLQPVPAELDQIQALAETRFRAKAASQKPKPKLKVHMSGSSLWKMGSKKIGEVHPSKLQIRVENRCEE